ncbi:unnamed protein product [Leptidea sinapis]|uniref:Uncharacterized protein n=1 Tax=Leptidea sinapis TaxID=189913 RepID=A0A5E4QEW8_9NEOP|nr:unnamed protein product [Leptidea sinapis]
MAPQERTDCCDNSRQNGTIDNLSNIDLSGSFVNKAYSNDGSESFASTKRVTDDIKIVEKRKKAADFDDLLPYVGEFGLYQKILFLLMIPFAFFVAFVYFSQIFMTIVPEQHWCWIPELANMSVEERRQPKNLSRSPKPIKERIQCSTSSERQGYGKMLFS